MLLGEAAACVVLESGDHAAARGAPVLGRVLGCGSANDAGTYTAPNSDLKGPTLAIERALAAADASLADISVIQAHGSGTSLNDRTETRVFESSFRETDHSPIVFATKSNFGHTLGATGTIEFIALLKALSTGIVPPNVGLKNPVSEEGFHLARSPQKIDPGSTGMTLTLGFGGDDTAIIVKASPDGI
jgi:3-oxoacyl-[acyl-carrier-protein] synthase II